jgi:hypothetical protein
MSIKHKWLIVALLLALLSVGYGLIAYCSYVMTEAFTAIVRGILNKPPVRAVHSWDEWLFIAISIMAAVAAIGIPLRKAWSHAVCILVLGVSGVWSLMMVVIPGTWRDALFSTTIDRWATAIVALLSIGGLAWTSSSKTRNYVLLAESAK